MGRLESRSSVLNTHKLFTSGSAILPTSNRNFIWDLLLRLFWIVNIRAIGSFYRCSRTNSYWPKLPYGFGVDTTTFGCGRSFLSTPKNFWALEQALIQLWQPQLNTPFIYQFFNCRKGLIPRAKFSGSRQFGFYSLWRKLRWKSTPTQVRRALHSPIFGRRVQLWEIIQDLGSNSIKRFHMEKRLRSNEIGQQGCYFIRRLANNLGEPQRSYAINAIDRALTFWKAKRVRKPAPLRAPWLLAANWTRHLRQLLATHVQ